MVARFFVRGLAGKVIGHIANEAHHKMDVVSIPKPDLFSSLDQTKSQQPIIDGFCYKNYEIIFRQYAQNVGNPSSNYSFSLFVQRCDGKDEGLIDLCQRLREEVVKGDMLHKQERRMMNGTPNVNFCLGSVPNLDPQKVKVRKPNVKLDIYFARLPDEEELFWIIYRGAVSPLMKVFRNYDG